MGFHWKADNSHGEKVVRYCFSWQAWSDEEDDVTGLQAAEELVGERRDWYRLMAPTAHNVPVNRPDLQGTPRQCSHL